VSSKPLRSWYYAIKGEQQGPVLESEMRMLVKGGAVTPATLVWCEGLDSWVPLRGLADILTDPPDFAPLPDEAIGTGSRSTKPNPVQYVYVSTGRLVVFSILSCGLYEFYWMYRCWQYVNERDHLGISPFWRACFGILYCRQLFRCIHDDPGMTVVRLPNFSVDSHALMWILLVLLKNVVGSIQHPFCSVTAFLLPSFLCLTPVQRYINAVNSRLAPSAPYEGVSGGQVFLILNGLFLWALVIALLVKYSALLG